tara:strand:- start:6857 stop:7672 length:816 start_codon:yes stop_codon:yes gene_type:complete
MAHENLNFTDLTLTFSENSQGWPSFYSYIPEQMIGMNNFFYSFKGGNIYQHNTNAVRNNYYNVQYLSQIKSVFNELPLENKVFKTLNIEGENSWTTTFETDLPNTGLVNDDWFVKKEGDWFAYIRSTGTDPANVTEYLQRSMNGIAQSTSVTGTSTIPIINFANSVEIGNIIAIGDMIYHAIPPYTTPTLAGKITNIEVDIPNNINRITLDATITGATAPSTQTGFILYIKNQTVESHGLLGHYMVFTMQNNKTTSTELFAVETEVSKSFP